ncbi:MAG: ATP-dependent sacrificial sulfur transferase LarE [Fibrobacter sp.]|nr:ATP-dependent sacrificial sulfur transferase LarE [Fibrobacter sp.]
MDKALEEKKNALQKIIGTYKSALIGFSGGVDSTLLAFTCQQVLKDKVLLVTATSSTYITKELNEATAFAKEHNFRHLIIQSEELDIPGFSNNPKNRCYYCKLELFSKLKHIALANNIDVVFDGDNVSDLQDYRPGREAAKELGIISPLTAAGMTKSDIRELSRYYKLPTSEKPAMACLASRFPYGETITREKLERVAILEEKLRDFGFTQLRVRSHDNLARIEFINDEIEKAFTMREKIGISAKNAGFTYCSIDVQGYRTGSMNESL